MAGVLAAVLLVVVLGAAASLLLALPVAVAAESLVGRSAALARRFWHWAAALPLLTGLALAGCAFLFLHGDLAASPHQDRIRPHLCLRALTALPDAPFRFQLYAWIALGLLVFAVVRLFLALRSAQRLERLRQAAPADETVPVLELPLPQPEAFTLGLWHPVVVRGSGLRLVLTGPEQQAVMAHEICHARHRDPLAEVLLRLVTDPLLWLPTTHYYLRQARLARERCCDEAAAKATAPEVLAAALEKLAARQQQRQQQRQGELARLRPVFPEHADPGARLAGLSEATAPTLAPRLRVMLAVEGVVVAGAVLWLHRPLHDTLYCLAESVLHVLR